MQQVLLYPAGLTGHLTNTLFQPLRWKIKAAKKDVVTDCNKAGMGEDVWCTTTVLQNDASAHMFLVLCFSLPKSSELVVLVAPMVTLVAEKGPHTSPAAPPPGCFWPTNPSSSALSWTCLLKQPPWSLTIPTEMTHGTWSWFCFRRFSLKIEKNRHEKRELGTVWDPCMQSPAHFRQWANLRHRECCLWYAICLSCPFFSFGLW